MKENTLGVHINMPETVCQIVEKLRKERFFQAYRNVEYDPHLTLHIAKYSEGSFEKLVTDLKEAKLQRFSSALGELKAVHSNRTQTIFVCLEIEKSPELVSLHEEVVMRTNKYRDNLIRQKDLIRLQEGRYDEKDEEYLKVYGYSRVFDKFIPHITLGETSVDEGEKVAEWIKVYASLVEKISFDVTSMVVGLSEYDTDLGRYTATLMEEEIDLL